MGVSTDGILAYGLNLGGADVWELEGLGEYGEWQPEWAVFDEDEYEDMAEAIERRLLAEIVGFTETDWQVEGFFARKEEAEKRLGLELRAHCSGEYTMYILSACSIRASRGYAEPVDLAALEEQRVTEEWDAKLNRAVEALGIVPKQAKPMWLLASYWG